MRLLGKRRGGDPEDLYKWFKGIKLPREAVERPIKARFKIYAEVDKRLMGELRRRFCGGDLECFELLKRALEVYVATDVTKLLETAVARGVGAKETLLEVIKNRDGGEA